MKQFRAVFAALAKDHKILTEDSPMFEANDLWHATEQAMVVVAENPGFWLVVVEAV
jgi:hypothetical protein